MKWIKSLLSGSVKERCSTLSVGSDIHQRKTLGSRCQTSEMQRKQSLSLFRRTKLRREHMSQHSHMTPQQVPYHVTLPTVWPINAGCHHRVMLDSCHSVSVNSPDSRLHCIPLLIPILVLMASPLLPSRHCHYIVFQIWRSVGSCGFQVTIIVARICGLVCYLVFHSLGNWKLVYRQLQFHCNFLRL